MPELPKRMRQLPLDGVGRPIPWFAYVDADGHHDFRIADADKLRRAITEQRCWTCGQKFTGRSKVFVIGPMCAVNRISAEPPSHRECAEYSVRACPFLNNPNKERREAHIPAEAGSPAGEMIRRNPGVSLLWSTASYKLIDDGSGGVLFRIGPAIHAWWWAEGRPATRQEVLASIESGLPILRGMAETEGDAALDELAAMTTEALRLVPA